MMSQDISEKYEDALSRIELLIQENGSYKSQNSNLSSEIQQLIARMSAVETAKEREMYELTLKLTNESKSGWER